ncbi:hypothetical protein [Calothrix sp. 336/3]|uniref:hypothetical protein n=1 Tax=Calothrix sp. 336/3 TaxID=1337936 RepID=UPI0004E3406C|nr:hypothetical protein [Calothrix sp. 336/3]AKG20849.1 hypothetical protein IJ00_05605 [Calothrix sp. 336/3]
MLSSEDKSTDTIAASQAPLVSTQSTWEDKVHQQQTFHLIESILSFEACLYHQIIPFVIEDNKLVLGIVNLQDTAALEYVERISSYINCTMVTEEISGETHRQILSEYLNYKNQPASDFPDAASTEDRKDSAGVVAQTPVPGNLETEENSSLDSADDQSPHYNDGAVVETPASVNAELEQNSPTAQTSLPEKNFVSIEEPEDKTKLYTSPTQIPLPPPEQQNAHRVTAKNHSEKNQQQINEAATLNNLTILPILHREQFSPTEVLLNLPPRKLLEELLGRVLVGGIGRLYLERRPYSGRILWSENGVLQSVLEEVPLSVFQGVLNELKRFGSLPMTTIAEPKQIEKECLYEQDRLLLRLRVMVGMYGEEATLQVLRGAALKFYQQQQLARLSRDALSISQQLNYKLHELQERLRLNRQQASSSQQETFAVLNQLLTNLDYQIKKLAETDL